MVHGYLEQNVYDEFLMDLKENKIAVMPLPLVNQEKSMEESLDMEDGPIPLFTEKLD